jgi:2-polyprenyl-3-methyl-5-hydroxy-6-metoxy-1,4-benzoquinol methylase
MILAPLILTRKISLHIQKQSPNLSVEKHKMKTLEEAREITMAIANKSLTAGEPMAWFEELYSSANGDTSAIPWSDGVPNPWMVPWFEKTDTRGEGKSAVVIGCGLGEDAEELARRGYNVTAFDLSPTAIEWCKKLYPDSKVTYLPADLFSLPKELTKGFDFIYECYTIQALPRSMRSKTIEAVASLLKPNGEMLLIARGSDGEREDDGPPWPLKEEELLHFSKLGVKEITSEEFWL